MVHQLLYHGAGHVLHDVTVHYSGDDGDGDDLSAMLDDGPDLFILDTHHILQGFKVIIDLNISEDEKKLCYLAVNLQEVVINQQTIPSRGGVHSYGIDLAFLELEPNMSGRVFV